MYFLKKYAIANGINGSARVKPLKCKKFAIMLNYLLRILSTYQFLLIFIEKLNDNGNLP